MAAAADPYRPIHEIELSLGRRTRGRIACRSMTSVELTDAAIAHIERDDNAICVPDFDRARDAACAADHEFR